MVVTVVSEELKMSRNNVVNELSSDTKKSLRTRIISAAVGLVVCLPLVFIGDWPFLAFGVFCIVVGAYEIVHSMNKKVNIWLYIVSIVLCVAMGLWPFISSTISTYISLILMFAGLVALFLVVILSSELSLHDACYMFIFLFIVALGLQATLYIRYAPSYYLDAATRNSLDFFNGFDNFSSCTLLVYCAFGCFMTDTGAYFIGVFFGKHKINERISPKKTYEGFFGGIIISALISSGFAFLLAGLGHPVLEGVFDLEHWYHIVGLSLLMPVMATLGDFVFSSGKRIYGIKDFGNILPGHGGVCDRLDSWFFVFITAAMYIAIVQGAFFL